MKRTGRSLPTVFALAFLLLAGLGTGAGILWLRSSLPQTEGEISLPGLAAAVTVTRDAHGIPWIEAETQTDAYFALGFVHAQDRLFQMDIMRRTGAGRLSEIMGPDMLSRDRLARALGVARLARASLEHLSGPVREALDSYSAGVNAHLATRSGALPPEFVILGYQPKPWRPVDSLIRGKLMALWLSSNRRQELLRSRLAKQIDAPLMEDLWSSPPQPGVTGANIGADTDDFGALTTDMEVVAVVFEDKTSNIKKDTGYFEAKNAGNKEGIAKTTQEKPVLMSNSVLLDDFSPDSGFDSKLGALFDGLWLDSLWDSLPPRRNSQRNPRRNLQPREFLSASNNWAISGDHTKSGAPLLANDPHLWMSTPGVWYLARLTTPETDLAGATAPGVPFTILGHNAHIAWGFSTTHSDSQDFFIERLDPENPGLYLTPKGSRSLLTRYEKIPVRDGEDDILEIRETRHGPVISDILEGAELDPGYMLALADPAQRRDDLTAQAIYRINMARDWKDFTAALEDFHSPQQNIVYADVAGNMGFYAPGRVPLRKNGDGTAPAPGWSGAFDWTGYIPFAELPHAFNPPSGRAVTANQKIVEDGYPHLLSAKWRAPYRARRIHEALAMTENHDPQSMAVLQNDAVSLMARDLLPLILPPLPNAGENGPHIRKARALLRNWDAVMDRDRPEPLIFSSWLFHLQKRMAGDELGELYDDMRRSRPGFLAAVLAGKTVSGHDWCDDEATVERESCATILRLSLTDALAALRNAYGGRMEDWRWGDAHRLSFANPLLSRLPLLGSLAKTEVETDGGNETVSRGAYRSNDSGTVFSHFHGAGLRAVYDLAEQENSLFMIAPGQSGNVFSRHFDDLVTPWRDGRYVTFPGSLGEDGKPDVTLRLNPQN